MQKITQIVTAIEEYLAARGFELSALISSEGFAKLALVKAGANAMCASLETRKRFEIQACELFRFFKYVTPNELSEDIRRRKDAISAIYNQMQEKRKHADNSALMAQINAIVSAHVEVSPSNAGDDAKKFDISKIDFYRLQREFAKSRYRNLILKDLQELIESRLARMLKSNPGRIDYYEHYQKIVNEYNQDNKRDAINILFENLLHLVKSLDDEEKRYIQEGFASDEELTIFDLLNHESLSQEEIKQVKALAQTLLTTVKQKIHEMDHWRDKPNTQSDIKVLIRDMLWKQLPASYTDELLSDYQDKIYEYVYSTYPAA